MKTECKILIKKSLYEILKITESHHDFPMHLHKKICVGIIDSGEKHLIINGEDNILGKDDLFFIPPYVPHRCCVKEGGSVSYTILCFEDINSISRDMMLDDISHIGFDLNKISSLYDYAAERIVNFNSFNDCKITALIKYINENCSEQLTSGFLADLAGINPCYLLHLFKEKTGLTLHQFIIQTRIKKIKEGLISENNMLDIALDFGFYDQSHFIRHFKKHVGITPKMFSDSIIRL